MRFKRKLALAFLAGVILICPAADTPPSESSLSPLSDNPGRSEWLLNGLYSFKPFAAMPEAGDHAAGSGFFARVPGVWFPVAGFPDQFMTDRGVTLKEFPGWTPAAGDKFRAYGLYEINFKIPETLKGRTALLNIADCRYYADIYFNGDKLGSQTVFENNHYNITSLIKYGKENNLRVALRGFYEFQEAYAPKGLTSRNTNAGILRDIALISPAGPIFCRFSALNTGLKKGEAVFTVGMINYSEKTINTKLRLELSRGGAKIREETLSAAVPPGETSVSIPVKLDGIDLWDPENPNLYDVSLTAASQNGVIMDSIPAMRTGFREISVEDNRVKINGREISFFGDSAFRIGLLMSQCAGEYPERAFAALKKAGLNFAVIRLLQTQPGLFSAADKLGVILAPEFNPDADALFRRHAALPSQTSLAGGKIPEEEMALLRKQFKDFTGYSALNPSAAACARMFNWLCKCESAYNPRKTGLRDPVRDERTQFAEDFLAETAKLDPGRLHYFHHGSGFGPVYTHNRYWSAGVPLQERCDFLKLWSENKTKDKMPYFVTEGWMFPGWPGIYPKWGVSGKNKEWKGLAGPYMVNEIAAMSLGPKAYFMRPSGFVVEEDYINRVKREASAYRYYGAAGHMLHTDCYQAGAPERTPSQDAKISDNIPGFVSKNDVWGGRHPSCDLTPIGQTFRHCFSPLTFFIMGPAENPTSAGHNFYSGEEIRKTLMAVNETGSAKKAVITVSLSGDGHTGSEQKFDFELRPGEKILRPMIFTAPDTATKKHFRLNAVMVCGETPSEQSFDLTIFPKSIPKTLRDKKIAVWDTDGSAAGLLKSIGAESVSLSDIDSLSGICLVVVGRNALNMQFARTAAKLGVPAWVRAGGRVIILEQAGEQEIGLRLDMRRAREVFKALPSHRVFAGLDDADLANWRGKSSLLEEFPTAAPGFHWSEPLVTSTLGVVSSFPAEKPHRGPFIPLMESGWDLQFSPLLEVRDGKGFIWICQLDLSRSERDPAADLLARNLLENALDAKAAEGAWLFTGDDRAETLLKKTGFSAQRLKQSNELSGAAGLILGPGGSAELSPREIEDFVRAGGVVICLPFGGTEKYLPLDISQTQVSADRAPASLADAEKRTVPASVSDLVWHDKFNLIGWDVKTGDGNFNRLMDQIPMGKGKIIYCGVDPEKFKGHYFMMKAFRLWSVLFCSLGVPAAAGAADRLLSCGSDTVIPLGGSALFKLDPKNDGLGQKWMDPGLKTDGGWDKIVVPGAWEKTPFLKSFGPVNPPPAAPDYNGVAWYRFDIDIPKDLKGTEAVLNMGVIDDYDTTFFNGVKIGGLGKEFGIHVYTAERAFSVPGELINWGGRNNITVRVEDNAGDGGIVSGKPRLEFLSGSSDGTDLYIKAQGIHEVFGVTPYYNEQW